MNALQAAERLRKLHRRIEALDRVSHYLGDEREFSDDIDELLEMKKNLEIEARSLTDRLSEVRL